MRVVQAFTREDASSSPLPRGERDYRAANQQTVVLNGLYFPFVDFLSAVATAIVLGYGGYLAFDGPHRDRRRCSPSSLPLELLRPGPAALPALQHVPLGGGRARQDHRRPRRGAGGASTRPGAVELRGSTGHVRFEGVRFGYRTGPEVLHGIDLDVPAGTTVALVGHTGAGKSTIAKLLARFYDPREGRITIDGHDLREVTQASLRRQLGVVPQEGFLFAGTVHENIVFGRPGRDPEEVVRGRADGRCARVHRPARGRLRDAARRARHRGSRSASASSSPSRERSSPTRASSSSTRRRRRWTSAPSGRSSARCGCSSRDARRSSSPTGSRRSATPTSSSSSSTAAIVEQGTHDELLARGGLYTSLYGDWAAQVA